MKIFIYRPCRQGGKLDDFTRLEVITADDEKGAQKGFQIYKAQTLLKNAYEQKIKLWPESIFALNETSNLVQRQEKTH
jgi:hypothetical protein